MLEGETPEELAPEVVELRLFRMSPLGTRISEGIMNPMTTRDLLSMKKTQLKKLYLEKELLKTVILNSYSIEKNSSPMYMLKMPNIRVSPKKQIFSQTTQRDLENDSFDAPHIETLPVTFPNIAEVFWSKLDSTGWSPETRQQASLTVMYNKLLMVGGVSRSINSDINAFSPAYKKWEKVNTIGAESEPRFGHSAVEYKQKLFIFGGGTDFNQVHKLRECLNGVKIFIPETKEFNNLKCYGSYIATRKQHCFALVGKHMFIQGGLNQKNNLLNDAAILNLEKNEWKLLNIRGNGPGFCGFHTAVTVLAPQNQPASSIFKVAKSKKLGYSGIYVFGGLGADRQALNTLFLLKIGGKELVWTVPSTQGQGPSPRFQHSMTYSEKLNIIVVFGGRIDISNTSHYTCFNDVHILNVNNLLWCSVKVLGNIPTPRSGHSAAAYGTKIYIFGGVSNVSYCSSSLFYLELNPKTSRQLILDEERRKARELEIEVFKAKKVEFQD